MQNDCDHILLTRFNLPSEGAESFVRQREGWLRSRVNLFEKYCLPSVEKQTVSSFHWIVYFDPQSPEWLKSKISDWTKESIFVPMYRATVSREELLQDLRAVSGARRKYLLTTNLDNDDGLSSSFVQRLQEVPSEEVRTALYFTRGLIRSNDKLFIRIDSNNAFCSVREGWDSAQTCWSNWHNLLGKSMKVAEICGDPAWLQVVHGSNVSNRVRGRRISPASFQTSFGPLLDGIQHPRPQSIIKDIFIDRPLRLIRDFIRSALKRAALALTGQGGLDRLKSQLISLRRKKSRIVSELTKIQREAVDDVPA